LEFALQAVEQAKAAEKYAVIIKKATSQPQCFEKILIENRIQLMKYSEMLGIKNNSLWQAEELDTLLSLEIYKLINERKMLVSEMNSYETELKKIKIKVDSCYDSRKKESDFRKKISGIKSLFEDEDAEILLSAENLVLRIFGVKFFSDNSYIPPEYFGVLNKLSQAIDDLGEQLITINVHTDSRGSAKRNRVISAKQAETVKIFLLANMTSKRLDIIAVGKGESMPIASNAGEKGRRLNRRIEVVIPLKISN
jgi:outer membrane protein OmpA-like peptidoglycan-associated protein